MKIFILHETQNLLDYNDHEVFTSYDKAKYFFDLVKGRLELEYPDAEEYTDEETQDEYYINAGDTSIRIYITEHEV
jgi:hypothetical protein